MELASRGHTESSGGLNVPGIQSILKKNNIHPGANRSTMQDQLLLFIRSGSVRETPQTQTTQIDQEHGVDLATKHITVIETEKVSATKLQSLARNGHIEQKTVWVIRPGRGGTPTSGCLAEPTVLHRESYRSSPSTWTYTERYDTTD